MTQPLYAFSEEDARRIARAVRRLDRTPDSAAPVSGQVAPRNAQVAVVLVSSRIPLLCTTEVDVTETETDWNPGTDAGYYVHLDSTARVINSMVHPVGTNTTVYVWLDVATLGSLTFTDKSAGIGGTGNKFDTPGGAGITIYPGQGVRLDYDSVNSWWTVSYPTHWSFSGNIVSYDSSTDSWGDPGIQVELIAAVDEVPYLDYYVSLCVDYDYDQNLAVFVRAVGPTIPAGSMGMVQYNDNGAMGADSGLMWGPTILDGAPGTVGNLGLQIINAIPDYDYGKVYLAGGTNFAAVALFCDASTSDPSDVSGRYRVAIVDYDSRDSVRSESAGGVETSAALGAHSYTNGASAFLCLTNGAEGEDAVPTGPAGYFAAPTSIADVNGTFNRVLVASPLGTTYPTEVWGSSGYVYVPRIGGVKADQLENFDGNAGRVTRQAYLLDDDSECAGYFAYLYPPGSTGTGDFIGNAVLICSEDYALQVTGPIAFDTPLGTASGGTGLDTSSAADGTLLIGNGAGLSLSTLTAGSGVTITNGSGSITIAASGGMAIGDPISGSSAGCLLCVDTFGNLTEIYPGTAGYVLTCNGSGTEPTFQALPAATIGIGTAVTSSTGYYVLSVDASGNLSEIDPATAGYVLTSNGPGSAATFQAASGGGIAIGDSVGSGTDYYLLSIDGSGDLSEIDPSTSGYVLTSNGPGSAATFQALPSPSGLAIGDAVTSSTDYNVLSVDGSGNLSEIDPSTAGYVLTSNGSGSAATFQAPADIAIGDVITSGTAYYILYVDGSGNLSEIAPSTAGYVLTSNGSGSAPSFQAASGGSGLAISDPISGSTDYNVLCVDGAGNLSEISPTTAGYVLTSNGTGAYPTFQAVSGGGGLAIGDSVSGAAPNEILYVNYLNELAQTSQLQYSTGYGLSVLDGSGNYTTLGGSSAVALFSDAAGDNITALVGSDYIAAFANETYEVSVGYGSALVASDGTHVVYLCDGTNNVTYVPGDAAHWAGSWPTDVWIALDRLAAAVAGLLGSAIP